MPLLSNNPRLEFDYVEDKSCFRAQCNCLCGTGTCRFCCRCCPSCKESAITRSIYVVMLFFAVLLMALFMSEVVQIELMKMFPSKYSFCDWLGAGASCHAGKLLGYLVVYRIGLAICVYHIIIMLSTCGVKSSKDCRAAFHNGLWIYKLMLVVVLILMSFFIPDHRDYFITVWMYIAMTGAAAFIVIQLIILILMIHKCTEKIEDKVDRGESAIAWFAVVAPMFAVMLFILSGTGICLLFVYFAGDEGCYRNQWFIMINAGSCLVVSFVAGIRRGSKPVGLRLFHASLICLYITYLTWVAITSAPRKFQKFTRPNYPSTRHGSGEFRPRFTMSFEQDFFCGPSGSEELWSDKVIPYISFIITFISVIYASVGLSEPGRAKREAVGFTDCPSESGEVEYDKEDIGGQIIIRDEKKSLRYSYSMFHLIMVLASLLMMMHLTEWHAPSRAASMTFGRSWTAVWIKMAACWLCLLIYFITILCPSVLGRRRGRREPPMVVEVNGHAYDSDSESEGRSYAESFEEVAVPLTICKRPTVITIHQETTV